MNKHYNVKREQYEKYFIEKSKQNMGIGMMIVVNPEDVDKTMAALKATGEDAYVIGEIKAGEKGVELC